MHWWFPTFDPELAAFSPGLLLLQGVIEAGGEIDARRIELGGGDYRFKQEFANAERPIASALVCRSSVAGLARAAQVGAGRVLRRAPVRWGDLPARAARRAYLAWSLRVPAANSASPSCSMA